MAPFWRSWLTIWCLGVLVFGVVLAAGGIEATSGPMRLLFALLGHPIDAPFDPHLRFSLAVMGAVSIGWSVTLYGVVRVADSIGGARATELWWWFLASALTWFVIDTALSLATGFGRNAIPNVALLVGCLVPLVRSGVLRGAA
jgi:hypothetical protein